ncbi:auxin-responsive protein SAUR32-like [Diospyros lotus]|uniref:auxin-responsive protein SAUR32-like n=1 Tax=Diospyros lotus TaxID=55363 RepID=UPI00224D3C39|nr:auxin-responsive protein SAUR32-like [Diospyros lotus]
MDVIDGKAKKGLIVQTWERCRSIGRGGPLPPAVMTKSRSWPRSSIPAEDERRLGKQRVAPEGCFSVYVGPQKQRFTIKTKYANHPLFTALLEEAESEYGHNSEGPLELPCEVDHFCEILVEMKNSREVRRGCNFAKTRSSSYRLLSPSRLVARAMNRS